MQVLLVEDEARVADFIVRGLRAEGLSITHVGSAEAGLELMGRERFDAVVLDLMLPGLPGLDFCRILRSRKDRTPVLILSALDALDERVAGLRTGADDYLPKPFAFDELLARLEALVRRASGFADTATATTMVVGPVSFDCDSLQVKIAGEEIELSVKEREMLKLFLSRPGRVFSRERIFNTVWGASEDPLTNVVDVYVGKLRRKLGAHGGLLKTVRGAGYRLDAEE